MMREIWQLSLLPNVCDAVIENESASCDQSETNIHQLCGIMYGKRLFNHNLEVF